MALFPQGFGNAVAQAIQVGMVFLPQLVKVMIRIPIYLAIIFGSGCASYLVLLLLWRVTQFIYWNCLERPW